MCLAVANSYYPSHQRIEDGTKLQGLKPVHYSSAGLDVIVALALFTLGVLGMHAGFLPAGVSVAFMGAGVGYGAAILALLGVIYSNLQTSQAILDAVETIEQRNISRLEDIGERIDANVEQGARTEMKVDANAAAIATNLGKIQENSQASANLASRFGQLTAMVDQVRDQLSALAAPRAEAGEASGV